MDSDDNLVDSIRSNAWKTLDERDVTVYDRDDITITQTGDNTYDVKVPITGQVLLDDLLDDQGTLLYMKDDTEIHLKGFEDDRLLLGVTLH
jgi:hypothetical protein